MKAQLTTSDRPTLRQTAARLPTGTLQRKCACGGSPGSSGECEACRKRRLQRKTGNAAEPTEVPGIVYDVLRSPGQPLDVGTRSFFEPRFGHDFSHVRVHADTRAAESARAVNALAYTVGRDVVFGDGQYAPASPTGRTLLAHELTHVTQQRGSSHVSRLVVESSAGAEREADSNADAVQRASPAALGVRSTSSGRTIARRPLPTPGTYRPPLPSIRPSPNLRPGQGSSPAPGGVARENAPSMDAPDADFYEMYEREKERIALTGNYDRLVFLMERPVATLVRGGTAPTFVTVLPPQTTTYTPPRGGTFQVKYQPHKFHILDAIDHLVSQAVTQPDLKNVEDQYVDPQSATTTALVIPPDLDPGSVKRREAFVEALKRRTRPTRPTPAPSQPKTAPQPQAPPQQAPGPQPPISQQPQLAPPVPSPSPQSLPQPTPSAAPQLVPQPAPAGPQQQAAQSPSAKQQQCRHGWVPRNRPNQIATDYCEGATLRPARFKGMEYLVDSGKAKAEFDSFNGGVLYECKCGYESTARAYLLWRNTGESRYAWANKALWEGTTDKKGKWHDPIAGQIIRERDVAHDCGFMYRLYVSNAEAAAVFTDLLSAGGNAPIIAVVEDPTCD